ncbi:hypothetical protein ACTGOH_005115, partial [Salmonella enterica subsp. enterica serovar Bareilly]
MEKTSDSSTTANASQTNDIVRLVLIDHIASTAYVRILNDPSDIMFSMYDVNTGLKHIILCMLEYMIPTFTEHGAWDT